MSDAPYTNEELQQLDDHAFPQRGTYCPKCRNFIPAFAALNEETAKSLRTSGLAAMRELRQLTGCNLLFAKIWAVHPHGPHPNSGGPPCPYCGRPLFSEKTKQCIQCGWDWHNPDKPVQHVVNLSERRRVSR